MVAIHRYTSNIVDKDRKKIQNTITVRFAVKNWCLSEILYKRNNILQYNVFKKNVFNVCKVSSILLLLYLFYPIFPITTGANKSIILQLTTKCQKI